MSALYGLVSEGLGGSSPLRTVAFDLTNDGIQFLRRDGEGTVLLPFSSLKVAQSGVGRETLIIQGTDHFPILYVREMRVIDALCRTAPPDLQATLLRMFQGGPARGWDVLRRVGLLSFVLVCALVATLIWGAQLVSLVLTNLPNSAESALGDAVLSGVRERERVSNDAVLNGAVARISEPLLATLSSDLPGARVILFDSGDINSFTAPGGRIGVSTRLLASCATPEEFAAVLAHQLEHAVGRHELANSAQNMGAWMIFGIAQWIVGLETDSTHRFFREISHVAFTEEQETEADIEAAYLLAGNGISAAGLLNFFGQYDHGDGIRQSAVSFTMSHPVTSGRLKNLRAEVEGLEVPVSSRWKDLDWPQIQLRAQRASEE